MRRKLLLGSIFGAVTLCVGVADAGMSSKTVSLSTSNTYGAGDFGSVLIEADDVAGTVTFTVDATVNATYYGAAGSNYGIQSFGFNYDTSAVTGGFSVALPTDWKDKGSKNLSSFGRFDPTLQGTGSSRQDPLVFTLTLNNVGEAVADYFATANADGFMVAAHIAGYTGNDEWAATSHWAAGDGTDPTPNPPPSTPLPGAVLLGVLGLAVVGATRRRTS